MKQEDKDLLLKDLCARLPYGVKCAYFNTKDEIKVGELLTVWCKEKRVFIDKLSIDYDGGDHIGVIPCLFPLSSMTEEQDEELKNIYYSYNGMFHYTERLFDRIPFSKMKYFPYQIEEFFNKNHIDYRGLIEKGLAIDATNKNIY